MIGRKTVDRIFTRHSYELLPTIFKYFVYKIQNKNCPENNNLQSGTRKSHNLCNGILLYGIQQKIPPCRAHLPFTIHFVSKKTVHFSYHRLFAVSTRTGHTMAVLTISGATNCDWEDISLGTGPGGYTYIYIGDVGGNTRK